MGKGKRERIRLHTGKLRDLYYFRVPKITRVIMSWVKHVAHKAEMRNV
jgi:hypothetical protein